MEEKNLIHLQDMKNLPDFFTQSKRESFSFSDSAILQLLREKQGTILVGSAMSDFQAEPLVYDKENNPVILSDWELHVSSKIKDRGTLPHFLQNSEMYFTRAQELGQNTFRISLDFARLCPKPFEFNETLMQKYADCLPRMKSRGLEPMVTFYHWPMPLYLLEMNKDGTIAKGGWEHPDVIKHFTFYVESVTAFLAEKNLCREFITINEPLSILAPGYLNGIFPPYKKMAFRRMKKVLGKLVEAHDVAYAAVKKNFKVPTRVGVAHSWPYFGGPFRFILQKVVNEYVTDKFERDGTHTDFIGMQYYMRFPDAFADKSKRLYGNHPDFGDVYPRGLFENLKIMAKRYPKKDIMITEFGFSEHTDKKKPFLILETMRFIIEAMQEDIPISVIMIWTLVNNLEWAQGMNARFGFWSEDELKNPLQVSDQGSIKGFEAWRSAVAAITNPTRENLEKLQADYVIARNQFEQSY